MHELTEGESRMVDSVSKGFGILGAILVAVWTIWTYNDSRKRQAVIDENAARSAAVEARKPLEAERLKLYLDAISASATIASDPDPKAQKQATAEFWKLYWGPLAMVEDGNVEGTMVAFGNCLKNNSCTDDKAQLALRIAYSCRHSLESGWDTNLGEVTKEKLEKLRQ
jgi:hypothetical protein